LKHSFGRVKFALFTVFFFLLLICKPLPSHHPTAPFFYYCCHTNTPCYRREPSFHSVIICTTNPSCAEEETKYNVEQSTESVKSMFGFLRAPTIHTYILYLIYFFTAFVLLVNHIECILQLMFKKYSGGHHIQLFFLGLIDCRFQPSTDIAGQTPVKTSVQRSIRAAILSQWKIEPETLESIWPKKESLVHVKWYVSCVHCVRAYDDEMITIKIYYSRDHMAIFTIQGEPMFFQHFDGPFYPTLRLLHKCMLNRFFILIYFVP
jgi:hypothetical protein